MAATPAAVTEGVTARVIKKSFAETFNDFLRTAPEKVSKQFIEENMLGKGAGFRTKRDIANRVTVAQSAGYLSTQDEDHVMKNTLAGKSPGSKTRPHKGRRSNGSSARTPEPRKNGHDFTLLDQITPYMDEVEALGQKVDSQGERADAETVTKLVNAIAVLAFKFNGAMAARLDS